MKAWCVATLTMAIVATGFPVWAANETMVKGPDGETLGVVLQCNDCAPSAAHSKKCRGGTEEGWMNGKPCGQCLVASNRKNPWRYPYDLHFTGVLKDAAGKPIKDRFVKLFTANGWSIRTRTSDQGGFRLMLGATGDRKSKQPVVTDLGTLVDVQPASKDAQFAMFLLPSPYEPCPADSVPPAKKSGSKKES